MGWDMAGTLHFCLFYKYYYNAYGAKLQEKKSLFSFVLMHENSGDFTNSRNICNGRKSRVRYDNNK